jgi:A/G-specific adenine glycosylase
VNIAPQTVLDAGTAAEIQHALLSWYRAGHRDLPWRRCADPYAIWISEIMLQQTRTETVRDYFLRFMARFPTPADLAAADLDEVLAHWSGLGYYARARHLHAAAREIAGRYGGRFPAEPEAVRALPGIGPYTAGAILSIAFGQRAPILDGNVIRVLSRLFALTAPPDEPAARRRLWALAGALVPEGSGHNGHNGHNDPGDFNQALMELGATVCLPRRPTCLVCPLRAACLGRRSGDPEQFPARRRERPVPEVQVVTLCLRKGGRVLLCRRPPVGLWGGLWEPPTAELAAGETALCGARRLLCQITPAAAEPVPLSPFVHVLTHRRMHFAPFLADLTKADPVTGTGGLYEGRRFVDPAKPQRLALSAWVSTLLARLGAQTTR